MHILDNVEMATGAIPPVVFFPAFVVLLCLPKVRGLIFLPWCIDLTGSRLMWIMCKTPPSVNKHFSFVPAPLPPDSYIFCFRSRNTTVHSEELFVGRTKAYGGGTPLKVNTAPKLAIVDLTRETHLFKNTESSNRSLKVVLQSILEALHPQGTMAFALPRPWLTTGFVVGGASDNWPGSLLLTRVAVMGYLTSSGSENSRKKLHLYPILSPPRCCEACALWLLNHFYFPKGGCGGGCS